MTGTCLSEGPLNGAADIETPDVAKRNGLVGVVHDGEILDMLESLDSYAGFNPAGSPVGEVVPSVGILVDSVGGIREVCLHHLPSPCPGEIGKRSFLLRVLIAVDCLNWNFSDLICI